MTQKDNDTLAFASTPPKRGPETADDLSAEIVATAVKQPGDVVRCTRVGSDTYRCNWWAAEGTVGYDNPTMHGLLVTTHRVRQSRFLRATKVAGRLAISDCSTASPRAETGRR